MNKRILFWILIILIISLSVIFMNNLYSLKKDKYSNQNKITTEKNITGGNKDMKENNELSSINITINNKNYTLDLVSNATTKALINILPLDIDMTELNGNEKYYYLDVTLPTELENPKEIKKGDVMLYGNNCIVIFYKSFNTSYSYTRIGHIDNLPDLEKGSINIRFSK